jgi:hypothetical protein
VTGTSCWYKTDGECLQTCHNVAGSYSGRLMESAVARPLPNLHRRNSSADPGPTLICLLSTSHSCTPNFLHKLKRLLVVTTASTARLIRASKQGRFLLQNIAQGERSKRESHVEGQGQYIGACEGFLQDALIAKVCEEKMIEFKWEWQLGDETAA